MTLHWSRTAPTEAGWYFIRIGWPYVKEAVLVVGVRKRGRGFSVSTGGAGPPVPFSQYCSGELTEWAGPIPEPEEDA